MLGLTVCRQPASAVLSTTRRRHEARMHAGDALDAGNAIEQQLLVGIHVLDHHLELVIGGLAGDQQAFHDLGNFADRRFEVTETLGRVLVHRNVDQRHQ
jgi:hypothetical protein